MGNPLLAFWKNIFATDEDDRRIRRAVLAQALISYVFGVIIVATGVNVVAGLLG